MTANDESTRYRLIQQLRSALLGPLCEGSWSQIEDTHKNLGLPWRPEFEPGWGKPKYVQRVLNDLPEDELISVGRKISGRATGGTHFDVEDALAWLDAGGIAQISELTRMSLARALDGWKLHPSEAPSSVLDRFAKVKATGARFEYDAHGQLLEVHTHIDLFGLFQGGTSPTERRQAIQSNHLALLDAYGFRSWPDSRVIRFLEFLVHPSIRQGQEQTSLSNILNAPLAADGIELLPVEQVSGHPVLKAIQPSHGVQGRPKNLIFASTGPKPELGFSDAVNNDIVILRNAEHCLVYDEPIGDGGLRWNELVKWWAIKEHLEPSDPSTRKLLGERLAQSLASAPERRLFSAYFKILRPLLNDDLPALVPQVYLHYDPITLRELRARGESQRFDIQRMDFLLLLPQRARVIVEIDGQQHYSTSIAMSAKPSPAEYARTVRSDRHLRLAGYEVYRFGGYELRDEPTTATAVEEFFSRLFRRHKILE